MVLHAIRATTLAIAVWLVIAPLARADYDAGQRAWDAGSVDGALSQWRAAANAGDRRAMLALGRLYLQGLGVLQDYVQAHRWFNLAASRGEPAALKERDALAAKMTPEERAEAQKLARAWRPGGGHADGVPNATVAQAPTAVPNPSVVPDRGAPPQAIREAQTLLRALGYRPGPADGIWGRRTGEAYRAFLRDAGLPAGKTLTPDALRAMRALAKRHGGGDPDTGQRVTTAGAAVPALSTESTLRLTALPPDALHRAAQAGDIVGLTAAIDAGGGCQRARPRGLDGADARGGQTLPAPRGVTAGGERRSEYSRSRWCHTSVHGGSTWPIGNHRAVDAGRGGHHD